MDDAALARAATGGDQDAFAAIYDRYAARLHDFAFSVLRDRDAAADVLQDTFVLAGSRLHQLRDPAKLRPWLYAIARHLALREIRRRDRAEPVEEIEVTDPSRDPADRAEAGDLAALVWAAAEGLNPRDRTVLDLHLRQGLEGQDLGDALGVGINQAYVIMSRLRDQVERSLGALLVARQGRGDCSALDALLSSWDGTYTTVWRKRVARHVDGCSTCSGTRKRVGSALAVFGATPALALPAELRDRVLGDVRLVSHTGRPWPADGFPPPIRGTHRRTFALAAIAIVIVLLAVAAASGLGGDPDAVDVAAGSTITTTTAVVPATPSGPFAGEPPTSQPGSVASSTPTSEAPSPTSSGTSGTGDGPAQSPPTSTGSPTTLMGPTAPERTTTTSSPGSTGAATTTTADRTTTTASTTTTTTTTTPGGRDRTPPTISGVDLDPAEVRSDPQCRGDAPTTSRVSVAVSDPSGVAAVTVSWTVPESGQVSMTQVGPGAWIATVGPFPGAARLPVEVKLTVKASDPAGNAAVATATLLVRCG